MEQRFGRIQNMSVLVLSILLDLRLKKMQFKNIALELKKCKKIFYKVAKVQKDLKLQNANDAEDVDIVIGKISQLLK